MFYDNQTKAELHAQVVGYVKGGRKIHAWLGEETRRKETTWNT